MMPNDQCCSFESIGNFRRIPRTNMFRSARPDKVSQVELDKLKRLNINTIYDLRSLKEYRNASGQKLTDEIFQPTVVKPSRETLHGFEFIKIDKTGKDAEVNNFHRGLKSNEEGKAHFIFDLLSNRYFEAAIRKTPMWYRVFIYFVALLYKVFGGLFFQKIIVHHVINNHGLLGVYKGMIDFSGKEICAVLRVMRHPENVPGVVCCAHGKDRTGIISALLMALCGADKHMIALEYSKTEEGRQAHKEELERYIQEHSLLPSFGEAKYSTMEALLEYIEEKYITVPNYLLSIGFDMEDQKRLISNIHSSNGNGF